MVVVDNVPYHNVIMNKAPNSNSRKIEMINWLSHYNIEYEKDYLKPQLYNLVKRNKRHYKKYKFYEPLEKASHNVVRLPPYHPDLNPIEMVWAKIKHEVAKRNVTFTLNDVIKLGEEEFSKYSVQEWQKFCELVKKQEDFYLSNEQIIDVQTEQLIISVNDCYL